MQGQLFHRLISSKIKYRLQSNPTVAILGPRQVGKSTLVKEFITNQHQKVYLDLEAPKDLLKLNDPYTFLSQHKESLVIIDEVQRKPDLFPILRVLIDENRRPCKYLILGSASKHLIKQSSESLAGRISYINMYGFNLLEVPSQSQRDIIKLWLRGGFPNSYLNAGHLSFQWRKDFIMTYLERDIPQLGFRIPVEQLQRLLIMLAHYNGKLLNISELAKSLSLSSKTVQNYIDILCELFLIRKLCPLYMHTKKRLVKSYRIYINDTGILHSLLNIANYNQLLSHPIIGASWEGFVICNILSILPHTVEASFYRTAAGAEIDLVLKIGQELWAIEIKKSAENFKVSRGYHNACQDIKADRKLVIYGGHDRFPYKDDIIVMGLLHILKEINKINI